MAAATPLPAASAPPSEHPLRNPNFRLWLIGGTISLLGDQFYLVALPWLVLELTGSAVALGTVMMAGAIPRVVLMLFGGAASDYVSARRIMMATADGAHRLRRRNRNHGLVRRNAHVGAVCDGFRVRDRRRVRRACGDRLPAVLVKREQLVAASSIRQTRRSSALSPLRPRRDS